MPTETGTYTVSAKYINDEISIILKTGQLTNEAPIVPGTYTDLQARIDATPEGRVLDLPYNFTYNPEIDKENFPEGVKITKDITINCNGFTISGNNTVR